MHDFLKSLRVENRRRESDIKYALIVYTTRNLGDDIQSIAALQFLPWVDYFVDRESIGLYKIPQNTRIIMNGWFLHRPHNWPPARNLHPLFVSFHITPSVAARIVNSKSSLKYLKNYSPIGCRDLYTKSLLEKADLPAYFSGCLTLTLGCKIRKPLQRTTNVLIVDLDEDAIPYVPEEILKLAIFRTNALNANVSRLSANLMKVKEPLKKRLSPKLWHHLRINYLRNIYREIYQEIKIAKSSIVRSLSPSKPLKGLDKQLFKRLELANERLNEIATASLVITSRLHAALPALAFGTPVVFVHRNLSDPRFAGLLRFLNCYDTQAFSKISKNIPWDNLTNPNTEELNLLRANLIKICENFVNSDMWAGDGLRGGSI